MNGPFDPSEQNQQKRILILRSLIVTVSSILPLPGISELMVEYSRKGLIEHLARVHRVELEEGAVSALLEEAPAVSRFGILATLSKVGGLLRSQKRLRRLLVGFQVLSGLETGLRTLETGILFAHYLSTSHMGSSLSEIDARAVRKTMLEASRATEQELLGDALSSLFLTIGQVALQLPGYVWERVATTTLGALPPPAFSSITQSAQRLFADLRLQKYAQKLAEHFDRKWSGPAVITVTQKPN